MKTREIILILLAAAFGAFGILGQSSRQREGYCHYKGKNSTYLGHGDEHYAGEAGLRANAKEAGEHLIIASILRIEYHRFSP